MKTIYGVKMTDLDDIVKYARGEVSLCNFLKKEIANNNNILNHINDFNKIVIDTSARNANFAVYNMLKPYKIIFVPVELIEERLLVDGMTTMLTGLSYYMTSPIQQGRLDEIKDKYEDKYESMTLRFNGFDSIVSNNCVMFIFDDGKKIEDVRLARPISIIDNVINIGTEYKCESCKQKIITDNKSLEGFLPDMRYEVKGNHISYYCKPCQSKSKRLQNLPHVGE